MSQKEFAESVIGIPLRTYASKIKDDSKWKIDELIKASELNEKVVVVTSQGKRYRVMFDEIDE